MNAVTHLGVKVGRPIIHNLSTIHWPEVIISSMASASLGFVLQARKEKHRRLDVSA